MRNDSGSLAATKLVYERVEMGARVSDVDNESLRNSGAIIYHSRNLGRFLLRTMFDRDVKGRCEPWGKALMYNLMH